MQEKVAWRVCMADEAASRNGGRVIRGGGGVSGVGRVREAPRQQRECMPWSGSARLVRMLPGHDAAHKPKVGSPGRFTHGVLLCQSISPGARGRRERAAQIARHTWLATRTLPVRTRAQRCACLVVTLIVLCCLAEIGTAFATHYYTTFDTNRAGLQTLYKEGSMLTFETEQFMGMQGIMTKLTVPLPLLPRRAASLAEPSRSRYFFSSDRSSARSLRGHTQTLQFQTVAHKVTTCDSQPTPGGGILTVVTGDLAVRATTPAPARDPAHVLSLARIPRQPGIRPSTLSSVRRIRQARARRLLVLAGGRQPKSIEIQPGARRTDTQKHSLWARLPHSVALSYALTPALFGAPLYRHST